MTRHTRKLTKFTQNSRVRTLIRKQKKASSNSILSGSNLNGESSLTRQDDQPRTDSHFSEMTSLQSSSHVERVPMNNPKIDDGNSKKIELDRIGSNLNWRSRSTGISEVENDYEDITIESILATCDRNLNITSISPLQPKDRHQIFKYEFPRTQNPDDCEPKLSSNILQKLNKSSITDTGSPPLVNSRYNPGTESIASSINARSAEIAVLNSNSSGVSMTTVNSQSNGQITSSIGLRSGGNNNSGIRNPFQLTSELELGDFNNYNAIVPAETRGSWERQHTKTFLHHATAGQNNLKLKVSHFEDQAKSLRFVDENISNDGNLLATGKDVDDKLGKSILRKTPVETVTAESLDDMDDDDLDDLRILPFCGDSSEDERFVLEDLMELIEESEPEMAMLLADPDDLMTEEYLSESEYEEKKNGGDDWTKAEASHDETQLLKLDWSPELDDIKVEDTPLFPDEELSSYYPMPGEIYFSDM